MNSVQNSQLYHRKWCSFSFFATSVSEGWYKAKRFILCFFTSIACWFQRKDRQGNRQVLSVVSSTATPPGLYGESCTNAGVLVELTWLRHNHLTAVSKLIIDPTCNYHINATGISIDLYWLLVSLANGVDGSHIASSTISSWSCYMFEQVYK